MRGPCRGQLERGPRTNGKVPSQVQVERLRSAPAQPPPEEARRGGHRSSRHRRLFLAGSGRGRELRSTMCVGSVDSISPPSLASLPRRSLAAAPPPRSGLAPGVAFRERQAPGGIHDVDRPAGLSSRAAPSAGGTVPGSVSGGRRLA